MIVLHLQKVTHSLSDEVSFFSDFEAFKSFLFMSRAFRKASCALRSSVRSASNVKTEVLVYLKHVGMYS